MTRLSKTFIHLASAPYLYRVASHSLNVPASLATRVYLWLFLSLIHLHSSVQFVPSPSDLSHLPLMSLPPLLLITRISMPPPHFPDDNAHLISSQPLFPQSFSSTEFSCEGGSCLTPSGLNPCTEHIADT